MKLNLVNMLTQMSLLNQSILMILLDVIFFVLFYYNFDFLKKKFFFFKVYINHRPAFGLDPYEIYNSFKILSKKDDGDNYDLLPRHIFLNELQSIGK